MKHAIRQALCLLTVLALLAGAAACTPGPEPSAGSGGTAGNAPAIPDGAGGGQEDTGEGEPGGTVLVAYFSATGNTRRVAQRLAAVTGGDLYEIQPAEPYTEADLDYGNPQSRSSLEMNDPDARPAIGSPLPALQGYTTVYLGYPIWHGQAPRILCTFVENCALEGVTVIPFCTSGGSGIGNSAGLLEELAGGGRWLPGRRFAQDVTDAALLEWVGSLA